VNDGGVGERVMVEVVVIDLLFLQQDRIDFVIGAFIDLFICIKLVLFRSLDDIGLLMTGDNYDLPVLLTLLITYVSSLNFFLGDRPFLM